MINLGYVVLLSRKIIGSPSFTIVVIWVHKYLSRNTVHRRLSVGQPTRYSQFKFGNEGFSYQIIFSSLFNLITHLCTREIIRKTSSKKSFEVLQKTENSNKTFLYKITIFRFLKLHNYTYGWTSTFSVFQ